MIRKGLKTDARSPLGTYLGCRHDVSERTLPDTGAKVRVIEYNMEDFLRSCVERYKELTGVTAPRRATTPFLTELSDADFKDPQTTAKVVDSAEGALREVLTKSDKHNDTHHTALPQQLKPYAAKVLKILYAARYARLDLLRAVCALAQLIKKWDEQCDQR